MDIESGVDLQWGTGCGSAWGCDEGRGVCSGGEWPRGIRDISVVGGTTIISGSSFDDYYAALHEFDGAVEDQIMTWLCDHDIPWLSWPEFVLHNFRIEREWPLSHTKKVIDVRLLPPDGTCHVFHLTYEDVN